MSFTPTTAFNASSFSIFQRSLMQNDDLPLADVVDSELFEQAFQEHGVDFGADEEDVVYTPAITLWALISQVFFLRRSTKLQSGRAASQLVVGSLGTNRLRHQHGSLLSCSAEDPV